MKIKETDELREMTIDKLIEANGSVTFEGKTYVLTQQAYIGGPDDNPYYEALAIIPADGPVADGLYGMYRVIWYPTQEWLDGDREEEGDACDWDAPYDISKIYSGYDLETGHVI